MTRKATINDLYVIHQLESIAFTIPLDVKFIYDELLLNPFANYFVYQEKKDVVAYIGYRVVDDTAEMMNFIVHPDFQRKGIGRKLLNETLEELKKINAKTVTLEVKISNLNAIKLYESVGFKLSHIRKNYYLTEDGLVYIKELV